MSIDEMIAVLQAAKSGSRIQRLSDPGTWGSSVWEDWDFGQESFWSFEMYSYRIKPDIETETPRKPKEYWMPRFDQSHVAAILCFSKAEAIEFSLKRGYGNQNPVHVREVLPE